MVKEAIFMMGLPGSGKTTVVKTEFKIFDDNKVYDNLNSYHFVSADEIRMTHPDYQPEHPELIHEECVQIAKDNVLRFGEIGYNIIMDGGGINNHYTYDIITKLKEFDYYIKIIFVNTPIEVCVERNIERYERGERFVPKTAIIEKAYKLAKSIEKIKPICDEFIEICYFTDSHIFVDLDGTCTEYQDLPVDEFGNIDFVQYGVFQNGKPVHEIIDKLSKLSWNKKIYVVSASPNSICNKDKFDWLKKHMPFIKDENIFFVGNRNFKHVFLQQLIKKLKLNVKDCTVIDDDHQVLEKYKTIGVKIVHPSKLLTNY